MSGGTAGGRAEAAAPVRPKPSAQVVVPPSSGGFAKHHVVFECYNQPLIPNNAPTDLIWDTLDEDTGDVLNAYTLPTAGAFQIQQAGIFSAALSVGWQRPAVIAGEIWCALQVPDTLWDNSANTFAVDSRSIDAGPGVQQEQSVCLPADWWIVRGTPMLKVQVWQTSGFALNINYAALVISRLGP